MRPLTGKELASILEKHGWQLARIHSSHHVYVKPGRIERISVPIHGNKQLGPGLQSFLLKSAGIEVES